ncbi:MAG TPA: universal stress protein UspA [Micromonosporaceae bacterium]|nr:universal stress protein UspA [Micromonosporaceae bacterium]
MNSVVQPVVVGVDGSPPSQQALQWAAKAAMARDLPLAILYASQFAGTADAYEYVSLEAEEAGQQLLSKAEAEVKDRFPDLACSTEFAHENPASALVDASRQAALVIVGNRGHGGFHDLLLGSTSLHTAMHAHCPVAVIRPTSTEEQGAAGRIVVGVDASVPSQAALRLAFAEASLTGRPVTAVHAFTSALTAYPPALMPQVSDLKADRDRARDLLARELLPWQAEHPDIEVDTVIVQGDASWALVQYSQGAHLVVVGSRGLGGFAGLIFGSVGHALIHHAGCPVLIARDTDDSQ